MSCATKPAEWVCRQIVPPTVQLAGASRSKSTMSGGRLDVRLLFLLSVAYGTMVAMASLRQTRQRPQSLPQQELTTFGQV